MEIWKPVHGLADRYEASSNGRVRGIVIYGKHQTPRILASSLDDRGYLKVYIIGPNGKKKTTRAHILVCLAFHGPKPSPMHTVNHKDGNKTNNIPDNLEWATPSQQSFHSYNVLGNVNTRPRGKGNHWIANYSDEDIRQIRKLHASGMGYHRITKALGNKTSWVAVQMIIKRKTYTHVLD
jgi:hypothetical protein